MKELNLNGLSPAKKFDAAVKHCKVMIKEIRNMRYDVAKIALEVCDITMGGRANSHQLSLANFALGVDVPYKTLYRWCREYRLVVSKLTPKQIDEQDGVNRAAIERILKSSNDKTSKKDVRKMYDSIANNPEREYMENCKKRLGNVSFSIAHKLVLTEVDEDDFKYIEDHVSQMYKAVKSAKKGVDLNLINTKKIKDRAENALGKIQ